MILGYPRPERERSRDSSGNGRSHAYGIVMPITAPGGAYGLPPQVPGFQGADAGAQPHRNLKNGSEEQTQLEFCGYTPIIQLMKNP